MAIEGLIYGVRLRGFEYLEAGQVQGVSSNKSSLVHLCQLTLRPMRCRHRLGAFIARVPCLPKDSPKIVYSRQRYVFDLSNP